MNDHFISAYLTGFDLQAGDFQQQDCYILVLLFDDHIHNSEHLNSVDHTMMIKINYHLIEHETFCVHNYQQKYIDTRIILLFAIKHQHCDKAIDT